MEAGSNCVSLFIIRLAWNLERVRSGFFEPPGAGYDESVVLRVRVPRDWPHLRSGSGACQD